MLHGVAVQWGYMEGVYGMGVHTAGGCMGTLYIVTIFYNVFIGKSTIKLLDTQVYANWELLASVNN